jgi:hypothetical protein
MHDESGRSAQESLRELWDRFHANRPAYLIPITVLTAIYLAFELSFNARLLDVVGGLPSQSEIDSIERWGRCISGAALALAIWGTVLMPMGTKERWSAIRWALILGGSATICIYVVYSLEGDLIDNLTARSSGAIRQRALYLDAVRGGILTGDIDVSTMHLTPEQLTSPEGKTFVALFPVFAYSNDKVITHADKALVPAVANTLERRLGNPEQAFRRYRPVAIRFGNLFNQYLDGVDRLHAAYAAIPQKQDEAWEKYTSSLPNGLTPETVPEGMYSAVRSRVKNQGVDVPDDWAPGDRQAFNAALDSQLRGSEHAAFEKTIQDKFGQNVVLPEDLTVDTYFALPLVQERMRSILMLPDWAVLPGAVDAVTFDQRFYEPFLGKQKDCEMAVYRGPPSLLAENGREQDRGRERMKLLLVPPIALAFSLIGALVHITKFSNYALRILVNRSWLNIRTIGLAVAVIGLIPLFIPNQVTTSQGFRSMRADTKNTLGPFFVYAFTWVIQAQPYAYPFDEGVRRYVLGGVTFGYRASQARDSSPDPCFPASAAGKS